MEEIERITGLTPENICEIYASRVKLPETIDKYYRRDYMHNGISDIEAVVYKEGNVEIVLGAYIHIMETNNGEYEIENVTCPVFFIYGDDTLDYDVFYPEEEFAEKIYNKLKNETK